MEQATVQRWSNKPVMALVGTRLELALLSVPERVRFEDRWSQAFNQKSRQTEWAQHGAQMIHRMHEDQEYSEKS